MKLASEPSESRADESSEVDIKVLCEYHMRRFRPLQSGNQHRLGLGTSISCLLIGDDTQTLADFSNFACFQARKEDYIPTETFDVKNYPDPKSLLCSPISPSQKVELKVMNSNYSGREIEYYCQEAVFLLAKESSIESFLLVKDLLSEIRKVYSKKPMPIFVLLIAKDSQTNLENKNEDDTELEETEAPELNEEDFKYFAKDQCLDQCHVVDIHNCEDVNKTFERALRQVLLQMDYRSLKSGGKDLQYVELDSSKRKNCSIM